MNKRTLNEAVRFAFVGGLATVLHYGIYLVLQRSLQVDLAYTIGYITSFIANFYLTAYFTFHSSPSWKKLMGMGGAHAINYILHITLLNVFLWIGISKTYAPIPVFAIAIPINFILVRFVFKKK